jgi:ElaA protein
MDTEILVKFPSMTWLCKKFETLTLQELYAILQLRNEVFVVEQHCSYQDCDNKDLKAHHVLGMENGKLLAYTRLLPPGVSYPEPSIGRVVCASLVRGRGIGRELMKESIQKTQELFQIRPIRIGAQLYLEHFYNSFGFIRDSDVYLEDNIPHIQMLINPK